MDYDMTEILSIPSKRKAPPSTNFEFSPKAIPKPKVKFAKSRSRFGDYSKWSGITKVL